ncbi:hypothetical protein [Sulfurimonas sp.]|uniref:hypothetical protein n=1 Tax=Sulfurimonas sp. TaxID=2022749 RepID=UPI00262BC21E|nr:hypothetical protein [Sulfurimonas sp.]MDD3452571.1 hypothetical protein [Sulfurimonas sp.]
MKVIDITNQAAGGGTASFPDQTGNSGKVLVTNGAEVFWEDRYTNEQIDTIIEQNGFGQISMDIMVNKPSITYPLTGATNFAGELTSSSYGTVTGFNGVHTHTQWQVSDTVDFSNIVDDSYTGNLTTWQPDYKLTDTLLYARVRYKSYNFVSEWSDAVSFTTPTAFSQTPIVTVRGADTPSILPYIETSEFVSYNGTDTHVSTSWRVKESGTVIWEDLENTTKKYTIRIPVGVLQPNKTYTFEARHNSETYADSAWGSLTLTTPLEFDTTPMLVVGSNSSPYLHIYNQDVDTFTKLPTISNAPTEEPVFVRFSPNDDYLYVYVYGGTVYVYERAGNAFNLVQAFSPSVGSGRSVAANMTKAGDLFLACGANSPYVKIYTIGGDGKLTQITSPFDVAPTVRTTYGSFSPDGNYLVLLHGVSPWFSWYKRNGDTWVKLANPDVMPTNITSDYGQNIAWSPDSLHVSISNITQKLINYRRVEDTLTKITNPNPLPSVTLGSLVYSADGQHLFALDTSAVIYTYSVNDSQYVKISNLFNLASGYVPIWFSPNGEYMAHPTKNVSPYIGVKKQNIDGTYTDVPALPAASYCIGNNNHTDSVCFSNTGYPQE